jgi:hypothetical protein
MARAAQVGWQGGGVNQGLYGFGAVVRGNARGTAMAEEINGYRKGGLVKRRVIIDHKLQAQLLAAILRQGGADQAPPVFRHKIDHLRGHIPGGCHKIPLVFPVLIIHNNDHFPFPDILYGTFDRIQHALSFGKIKI